MKNKLLLFKLLSTGLMALLFYPLSGQHPLLHAGPMPGYTEMKEASIWLQTRAEAKVYAAYRDAGSPEVTYRTNTVATCREKAFTALLIADSVEPGRRYQYDL